MNWRQRLVVDLAAIVVGVVWVVLLAGWLGLV